MQKILLFKSLAILIALTLSGYIAEAQVKIGNNPTTLNPGAVLEVETTNRGILLPRVSLSSTTNAAMGTSGDTRNAVTGMTVYNTNASVTGSASYPANGIGNYTFDGTGWIYGDLPRGGTSGQVLSRTATGTSWTNSGAIQIYDVKSTNNASPNYGIIVTATGAGVTYDVNATTNTLTVNIPAGVRLLSLRVIESQARFGNADLIKFVFQTAASDALNTSYLKATFPIVQFYNYSSSPPPIVSRAVRMDSATNNQLTVSVTQMTSYDQYLFLFNF